MQWFLKESHELPCHAAGLPEGGKRGGA